MLLTEDWLQVILRPAPGRVGWRVVLATNTHQRISSLSDTFCPLSWLWQPQDLKHSHVASIPLNP